jgi:hypothetical protein
LIASFVNSINSRIKRQSLIDKFRHVNVHLKKRTEIMLSRPNNWKKGRKRKYPIITEQSALS